MQANEDWGPFSVWAREPLGGGCRVVPWMDLRERVVAAVKTGGLSCNQAAKQFGVGISTATGSGACARPAG